MLKNLKLRTKLILGFFFSSLPVLLIGYYSLAEINKTSKIIKEDMPFFVQDIFQKNQLNDLAQQIKYYDEILTQSARNYAFTKDEKWKERYNENVLKLDEAIKKALQAGDAEDRKYFDSIDAANIALVKMETEALDAASRGEAAAAVDILESQEYWRQKNIYQEGLDSFLKRRTEESQKSVSASLNSIINLEAETRKSTAFFYLYLHATMIALFIFSLLLGVLITNYIIKRLKRVQKAAKEIALGNFSERVKIDSGDEIGELGNSFNVMAIELAEFHKNLEDKVKERTEKLEQADKELKEALAEAEAINKLMVGRELEMIELKKEIIRLENKI